MDKHIVVIGSGFAGMWAALSASRLAALHQRKDIRVTVLAPHPELRVRPRFYEPNPASLTAPLLPLFAATGVEFCSGWAKHIDSAHHQVSYQDELGVTHRLNYDRLVLASGSQIDRTTIQGAQEYGFDIDSLDGAVRLEKHLNQLANTATESSAGTVIVAGGGLTGIELATELPSRLKTIFGDDAPTKVIVVDRADRPGGHFSPEMSAVVEQAIAAQQIEWRTGISIETIEQRGVTLTDGNFIPAQTVVVTAGVKASPLTAQTGGQRDNRDRLLVNDMLEVEGAADIFATGDVAHAACDDKGHLALMTCQHAIPMGKFAGHNAAASLMGIEGLPYQQPNYVTCVDLGSWGAVYTEGWEQAVKSTESAAKEIKVSITNTLIYPPQADREIAFTQADPLAPFV